MSVHDSHLNRYWLHFCLFRVGHKQGNHPAKSPRVHLSLFEQLGKLAQRDSGIALVAVDVLPWYLREISSLLVA